MDKAIYLGEDVRHGGYYSVTEGAADKYKLRVQDFPPDETSLVGAALGYAQVGVFRPCIACAHARVTASINQPTNQPTNGPTDQPTNPLQYQTPGLLPVCEIPYAKYLDCGADMFFETVFMNWLTKSAERGGVFFRLQGFGRGVFGGNFHTHNSLHLPPGLDVVCFSNGHDYVRGFRHGMKLVRVLCCAVLCCDVLCCAVCVRVWCAGVCRCA